MLLGVTSVACGATPSADTTSGTNAPGDTSPARVSVLPPSTTSTTARPARFEFVDYRVAGGIAGLNDHLRVFPDGRAIYDNDKDTYEFTVPLSTVKDLMSTLEAANLPGLPPVDTTSPGSADLLAYRVIYGGRSVTFHDATTPASLMPALTLLNKTMAQGKTHR